MSKVRDNLWTLGVAVVLVIVLVVYLFSFKVPAGSEGVVLFLGGIDRVKGPGLNFKWVPPIEEVRLLDMRTRLLRSKSQELQTRDKHNLNVTVTTGWRIRPQQADRFVTRLRTVDRAETTLISRVESALNRSLGEFTLNDLINDDFAAQQENFTAFEQRMFTLLNTELDRDDLGITVDYLAVQRLEFPEGTTEKVFERMKKERSKESAKYRSRGESEAKRIREEAQSRSKVLVAQARSEAQQIRGEGDAKAAEYYAVFQENPALANYLRGVRTLRSVLDKRATLLLYTNHAPFYLLEPEAVPQVETTE